MAGFLGEYEATVDAKGRFLTEVKPGSYAISVTKQGYQTKQIRVQISKPGNEVAIQLEKTPTSNKIQWNPSVFNYVTNAPLAGAVMVGQLEAFSSFWASAFKELIVFTVIIPILLWRSLVTPAHDEDEE